MSKSRYSWYGAGGSPQVSSSETEVGKGTTNAKSPTPAADYAHSVGIPRPKQTFSGGTHDNGQSSSKEALALARTASNTEHRQAPFPGYSTKHKTGTNHGRSLGLAKAMGGTSQSTDFMSEKAGTEPSWDSAAALACKISSVNGTFNSFSQDTGNNSIPDQGPTRVWAT